MAAHPAGFVDLDADLKATRAICHVDLDAFYAQVEEQCHPHLRGMSIAVIQYNPFGDLKTFRETDDRVFNDSNGSIIALSYGEARKQGVKRNMRGAEARQLCPSLQLVQVPTSNGKADLTSYRRHGAAVLAILSEPDGDVEIVCEKASIDESYLDVTDAARQRLKKQQQLWADALPSDLEQVHVGCQKTDPLDGEGIQQTAQEWYSRPANCWTAADALLAHASQIVAEKRAKVHAVLGFTLSAGVAHSKLLAKLCSGLNKPKQQTVLPASSVPDLLHDLPLSKLRGLGGQLGDKVQSELGVNSIGELSQMPVSKLNNVFGEDTGNWLYNMCRGVDRDTVQPRLAPKSVGCGKSFTAHLQITKLETAQYWLPHLAQEIHDRLDEDAAEHGRRATRLVLHVASRGSHTSKGAPLPSNDADAIAQTACRLLNERVKRDDHIFPITGLSLVASSFDSSAAKTANLRTMFAACQQSPSAARKTSRPSSPDVLGLATADNDVSHEACCSADTGPCRPTCVDNHFPDKPAATLPACSAVAVMDSLDRPSNDAPPHFGPALRGADSAALQQHQSIGSKSGHMAGSGVQCGPESKPCYDRHMKPSNAPMPTLPQSSRDTQLDTNSGTYEKQLEVDAITLAQMPGDIRSELYLMSSNRKLVSNHQQSTGSLRSGSKNKTPPKPQTSGIAAFMCAKKCKRA